MKDPRTGKRPRIKKRNRLSDLVIEEYRQKFMGKKVRVKNYKSVYGITDYVGIVTFFGYNEMLPKWNLQITINRLPLSNVTLEQIELVKDKKTIKVKS